MLHFHHSHHKLDFPHVIESLKPHHQLQFAPVAEDDDELGRSISDDPHTHGNDWQLTQYPDTTQLDNFWEMVEKDLSHSPEDADFTD